MASISSMLDKLNESIDPLYFLVTGFAYMLGIMLFWTAIRKLKDVADYRAQGGGKSVMIPLVYLMGAGSLLYLPTMYEIARNTLWGSNNPIAYTNFIQQFAENNFANVSVMNVLKFIGVVWFIRGIVLLVQASEPGVQHGKKGLFFFLAGIFGMYIQYTVDLINQAADFVMHQMFKS